MWVDKGPQGAQQVMDKKKNSISTNCMPRFSDRRFVKKVSHPQKSMQKPQFVKEEAEA